MHLSSVSAGLFHFPFITIAKIRPIYSINFRVWFGSRNPCFHRFRWKWESICYSLLQIKKKNKFRFLQQCNGHFKPSHFKTIQLRKVDLIYARSILKILLTSGERVLQACGEPHSLFFYCCCYFRFVLPLYNSWTMDPYLFNDSVGKCWSTFASKCVA